MLLRGILGSGQTRGFSFRPLPNSSGWWWLISSVFLIRISCHKTTHANGYYGAWPGWAVSINVFPLTTSFTVSYHAETFCKSPCLINYTSSPQLFWHQGPVSWKQFFHRPGSGGGDSFVRGSTLTETAHPGQAP